MINVGAIIHFVCLQADIEKGFGLAMISDAIVVVVVVGFFFQLFLFCTPGVASVFSVDLWPRVMESRDRRYRVSYNTGRTFLFLISIIPHH